MPSSDNVFAERLRERRTKLGLLQAQLAEKAGLPATAISHFEAGARKPSFDSLRALANALECTTDWLIGRVDDPGETGATDRLHRDLQNMSTSDRATVELLIKALAEKSKRQEK